MLIFILKCYERKTRSSGVEQGGYPLLTTRASTASTCTGKSLKPVVDRGLVFFLVHLTSSRWIDQSSLITVGEWVVGAIN